MARFIELCGWCGVNVFEEECTCEQDATAGVDVDSDEFWDEYVDNYNWLRHYVQQMNALVREYGMAARRLPRFQGLRGARDNCWNNIQAMNVDIRMMGYM